MARISGAHAAFSTTTRWTRIACTLLILAVGLPSAFAGFNYLLNGELKHQQTVQMWYEGYWKEVGWVNGTIAHYGALDVAGKIVIIQKQRNMNIETIMKDLAEKKPLAVIWAVEVRKKDFATPGALMYTGTESKTSHRRLINYPVAEAEYYLPNNFSLLPDGAYIEALWEENRWKTSLDTHFQTIIASIFLSLWEAAIIIFGLFRIYQFYMSEDQFSIFSIGPLCLLAEVIGSSIRFGHTIGDPFYAYRRYPLVAQTALATIHLPFTYASGILLTFFWAETLSKSNVLATPFISKYKGTTIVSLSVVVVVEIIATTIRCLDLGTASVVTTYVHILFYLMLTLAIIASFLLCAIAIWKRIGASGTRKHTQIKSLTIRFGTSIFGYILLIGFLIGIGVNGNTVVVFHLMYDFAYISLNWVATLQIWALRPPRVRYSRTSRSSKTTTSSEKMPAEDSVQFNLMH